MFVISLKGFLLAPSLTVFGGGGFTTEGQVTRGHSEGELGGKGGGSAFSLAQWAREEKGRKPERSEDGPNPVSEG